MSFRPVSGFSRDTCTIMEENLMARWDRAIAALPFRQGRVLDLGCSIGYATAKLRRRGYQAVGVDNSPRCIGWANCIYPEGEYLLCSAEELPLADASFDGILCLDVLEHVAEETATMREIRRILKPGGTLVISVPHHGLLRWLDSLNLYAQLVRVTRHGFFPQEIVQTGIHRHYSLDHIRTLLGSTFRVQRVSRTGLGLAELVNLPLLVVCRYILLWEWAYEMLRWIFWLVYLLEELFPVPLGRLSWHLMVVAMKEQAVEVCTDQEGKEKGGVRPGDAR
jgi:2-polyprenyl-3-methyl-5-hydroxy-6-metoxy-1,4-benzoquinol methylase